MKKARILSFALALITIEVNATEDSTKSRITEAYLLGGSFSSESSVITLSQYQSLNPDSKILQDNFNGFRATPITKFNSSTLFYMGVGYNLKKGSFNPTLRAGLAIGSGNTIEGGFNKNITQTIDTLVSPRTGATAYVDSTYTENYSFSTRSDIVQLDISCIWRTRNPNRITLFGGIGIFAGTSFNVYSTISHSSNHYIKSPDKTYSDNHSINDNYKIESETFKNKNHSTYGLYIPFGLDIKLGKTSSFWKHFHLVFEGRMRLQKYSFGGLGSEMSTPFNGMSGIRYRF